ncbi:MBL fold metallo-hydrolase [Litoreibacter janthinus]|uniref:Metallo-beta-lactamase class B n=1 Tax=Litoreibacter janthinus TaxID=670154 RepID=A0A1I6GSZ2_9RHOB|nr:MBL fold metallo-hydrolase [Litoreibacter janthinus]SFR45157.1 metallo-beta-lactamase class B [Litoreibacter janthinus]
MKDSFTKVVGAALAIGLAMPASAQALFDGCPSDQILSRFVEFGRTGQMPPDLGRWLSTPDAQFVEPWAPFDNVDYVGICWVSAWLVHTDDGTVLIDTLYGPFTPMLLDNIAKTGTDLADIKYVLMTHGHFDHVAGAAALKPLLPNATFVMTQGGWDEAVESSQASQTGPRAWDMIEPEMVVADGDTITLGDNGFTVVETPGHTWGTASYMYDVADGDETYRAITIGGLGLNAIEGPPQVEAFIESLDRVRTLTEAQDMGIDVHLTTHGFSNGLDEDRQAMAARSEGEPNAMIDPEGLLAQIETLRSGAVERLAIENNQ